MNWSSDRFNRAVIFALLTVLLVGALALSGCNKTTQPVEKSDKASLKIGTLPTDDLLPIWVAQEEGILAEKNIDAEIIVFQSAQEQIAAMAAGELDAIMTDMVVSTQLAASPAKVKGLMVLSGAPATIVVRSGSSAKTPQDLAGVPVGNSSSTALEHLFDRTMEEAGVAKDQIVMEEIKKVPVRYEMLNSDKIDAAVLPWTFVAMARASGHHEVLSEDEMSKKTQVILSLSEEAYSKLSDTAIKNLADAFNQGAEKINADKQAYLDLLIEKAGLPEPLKGVYEIRSYEKTALPDETLFLDVVSWMQDKGYIDADLGASDLIFDAKF